MSTPRGRRASNRTTGGVPAATRGTGRPGVRWTEFAAVDNQLHFHPDPRLGGIAILVLMRRSALRPAGVHLRDPASQTWWRAVGLDELPPGTWVRLSDPAARPVPVEVLRTARTMCVRWLGDDGEPVEPSTWDRSRIAAARVAMPTRDTRPSPSARSGST